VTRRTIENIASFVALFFTFLFMVFVGFMGGMAYGMHKFREQAVSSGHAKWLHDEDGRSTFAWMRAE